jgi:CDP-diacylglycerol--glycerol-3-phosphate 3-phosphatidyltransferase
VISPIFLVFLVSDVGWQVQLALLLFAIGAFTDYLDGFLARRMNLASSLGKFLDPLADKVLTLSAFFAFYLIDIIPFWAFLIFALRDITTTVMRVVADGRNYDMKTSGNAKVKTFLQMGFIIFILFLIAGELTASDPTEAKLYEQAARSEQIKYILYILLVYTIFTLVDYLKVNRTLFRKS